MDSAELKKIVGEVLGTEPEIDSIDPPEVEVYTKAWFIETGQLDQIRAKGVNVLNISAVGGSLTLRVKL